MGPGFESLCVHHEKLLARTTKCGLKIFQCLAVARQILGMIFFGFMDSEGGRKVYKHHPMGGVFYYRQIAPRLYIQFVYTNTFGWWGDKISLAFNLCFLIKLLRRKGFFRWGVKTRIKAHLGKRFLVLR